MNPRIPRIINFIAAIKNRKIINIDQTIQILNEIKVKIKNSSACKITAIVISCYLYYPLLFFFQMIVIIILYIPRMSCEYYNC